MYSLYFRCVCYLQYAVYFVQAKPPPASSTGKLDIWQSTLFSVLCVTALGLLPTLFLLAYVCSPIYSSSTAVRILSDSLQRNQLSGVFTVHRPHSQGWMSIDTFCLPMFSKRIYLHGVNDALFQFTKVTTASLCIT